MGLAPSGMYSRQGETQALDFRLLGALLVATFFSNGKKQYHMKENTIFSSSNFKKFGTKRTSRLSE